MPSLSTVFGSILLPNVKIIESASRVAEKTYRFGKSAPIMTNDKWYKNQDFEERVREVGYNQACDEAAFFRSFVCNNSALEWYHQPVRYPQQITKSDVEDLKKDADDFIGTIKQGDIPDNIWRDEHEKAMYFYLQDILRENPELPVKGPILGADKIPKKKSWANDHKILFFFGAFSIVFCAIITLENVREILHHFHELKHKYGDAFTHYQFRDQVVRSNV